MSYLKPALIQLFGFILCCQTLLAQNGYQAEIDSITKLTQDPSRNDTLKARDYVELSTYYFRQNIDTVVAICYEGISFIKSAKTKTDAVSRVSLEKSEANLLMNTGFTYYYLNKLDFAIEAFYQSLELAEKNNDKNAIADVRTNIANVQIDLDELESAEENLQIALRIQEELGDDRGLARTLNTIGYVHRSNGDNEKALEYYNRALTLRMESGDWIGVAACYNNIAYIHRDNGNFSKAIENYDQAITIYEEEDELTGAAVIYGNLANCYLEVNQNSKALINAKKGYVLAKDQGSVKDLMYLSEVLYLANKQSGNFKAALQFHEEYSTIKDSITVEKHYKELINQELEYEFAEKEKFLQLEKEKEIAIKEMEHAKDIAISEEKNTRLFFIVGVVSIGLLVVIILLVLLGRQKRTIEKQSKELELIALRTQMNPHFLFNSLNSIKLFIIENEKDLSTKYLTKFSKLVRMVLENSNKNFISLEDELEATRYYLELEQIRFKNKFEFEIINGADGLIELPPLVLQPYVENAIWHGVMHLDGNGKISVRTSEDDHGIYIEIQDNGVGRKRAAELKVNKDQKQSMGMDITQKRIQSLNEILGAQPTIEIIDLYEDQKASGTLVKISIPFHG